MNRLIQIFQLARDNAATPRSFRVAQVVGADEATVYVYDAIGEWFGGIGAEGFAKALSAINAKTIHLRVNSPGGDVFDAQAMQVALHEHPAEIIAHVDGVAASAASTLILSADRIKMARGARIMIHEAWTLAMGNKRDLGATAALLQSLDDDIVAQYHKRTKKPKDEIVAMLEAETWLNADDAVAQGFADEVVEVTGDKPEGSANHWNLSAYKNAPKDEPVAPPDDAIAEARARRDRHLRLLEVAA